MNSKEIKEALEIIKKPITVNCIEYKCFDDENYNKLLKIYENCLWFANNFEQINLTIENLQKENQKLKEQLQQKEDIINKITNYCKFQIEKEQDKFPQPLESEKWLKERLSAFEEILDMECIRNINKYQKDQENKIDLLLNKLQQKEDIIYKIKKCIEEKEEYYGDYMGDGNYTMYSMMGANNNRIPYIKSNLIKQILDNKGE